MGLFGSSDKPSERAKELVENAEDKSVNAERLTKLKPGKLSRYLHDKPLIKYLNDDEQPNFILAARMKTPTGEGTTPDIPEQFGSGMVLHMITDDRWLTVVSNSKDGDQTVDIPMEQISAVDCELGGHKMHMIELRLSDGKIEIPIANIYDDEDVEAACSYLEELTSGDRNKSGSRTISNRREYLSRSSDKRSKSGENSSNTDTETESSSDSSKEDYESVSEALSDTDEESLTDLSDDDSVVEELPNSGTGDNENLPEKLGLTTEQFKEIEERSNRINTNYLAGELGYLNESAPFKYLLENEYPKYLLSGKKKGVNIYPQSSEEANRTIKPGPYYKCGMICLVTDHRILILVGKNNNNNKAYSIPLSKINSVYGKTEKGLTNIPTLGFSTDGYNYKVYVNINTHSPYSIEKAAEYIEENDGVNQSLLVEEHSEKAYRSVVCRECNNEVPTQATTCPHCGYRAKDEKKGALWWGTAGVASMGVLAPVGAAMGAKGAKGHATAAKGVQKSEVKTEKNVGDDNSVLGIASEDTEDENEVPEKSSAEIDPLDKIEKLSKLHEQEILSTEEFEKKKQELLEQV